MGRFPLSHSKSKGQFTGQWKHLRGQHGCVNELVLTYYVIFVLIYRYDTSEAGRLNIRIRSLGSITSGLSGVLQA